VGLAFPTLMRGADTRFAYGTVDRTFHAAIDKAGSFMRPFKA